MNGSQVRGQAAPAEFFDPLNGNLPPMPYRDMPEPLPLGKVLGPSVILAGSASAQANTSSGRSWPRPSGSGFCGPRS